MRSLGEVASDPLVRARLAEIVEGVTHASDCGEIQALLHLATQALGAERSFFASMSGVGRETRYAFVLDCDPTWWHGYRATCPLPKHPWLAYASRHSAPVRATQLAPLAPEHQEAVVTFAVAAGFASAALVPVHSGPADNRASLLCLGHSVVGYYEDATFAKLLHAGARSLAIELHEWWTNHEQKQLSQRTLLSDAEVRLLERHCAGLSSKQIARELQVSRESINSRFQRIIAKLGVRNRRAAARVAIECGLIIM